MTELAPHFDFYTRAVVFCELSSRARYGVPKLHPHRRPIFLDARGRARVSVPRKWWRFANSGRWQWLGRLRVMLELDRKLRPDEHVHHTNGHRNCDRLDALEVVLAEYHGSVHATAATLAGWREGGKFSEWQTPGAPREIDRAGAVIGEAARELLDAWQAER